MRSRIKLTASLAVATLAAAAGSAFADRATEISTAPVVTESYYYTTPIEPYYAPGVTVYETAPTTTYYYDTAPATTYVPTTTTYYTEPPIVVTAPRSEDEAITNDVVDTLASDPRISGNIGVETFRNNVTLTGRVLTPTQAEIAARDAHSVDGVRDVENRLRARVGEF